MTDAVLDASAILAWLYNEPGKARVDDAWDGALLSSINAAEVVTRLVRDGVDPPAAIQRVRRLPCSITAVDEQLGFRAGALFAATRHKGLSLGDRVCLALAEREGLAVLTTDRAWADLDLSVEIVLIR
jgi:PIN domain nuclease of toxin-antitoxin system